MANLKEIRNRIASVSSTMQITSAMKMVSAAKLKKAQDAEIVVINIDNRLDPEFSEKVGLVDVPFISVDNEQAAYLSAKYISDQITSPTDVAILEGIILERICIEE